MSLGTEGNTSLKGAPFLWTLLFGKGNKMRIQTMKRYRGCDKCYKVLPSRIEASKREIILI